MRPSKDLYFKHLIIDASVIRDHEHFDLRMVNSRIAPRYRMNKPAVAEYGGDKYPCLVRDLSTTGAALEFSDANLVAIAAAFTLVIPDEGLRLPCHVVWKRNYRMGVAFD